jgi:hypothetical protein
VKSARNRLDELAGDVDPDHAGRAEPDQLGGLLTIPAPDVEDGCARDLTDQ